MLLFASVQSFGAGSFDFDQQSVDQEFQKFNEIEELVAGNPDLTYQSLQESYPELTADLSSENGVSQTAGDMPILGPFWWGCILGIIGLLLVYVITDNDKAQLKSALVGCVVGTLVWGTAWALSGSFLWW